MTIPRDALEAWLNDIEPMGYAVAKAPDLWSNLERGGDWDLVLRDLDQAEKLLHRSVGRPQLVVRRSYVHSHFFGWGHIDLLPGLQWRAVELASAQSVIDGADVDQQGYRIASPAHQALAACVYPRLAHGHFRDRYSYLLRPTRGADQDFLNSELRRIFGPSVRDVDSFSRTSTRRLRYLALAAALTHRAGWRRGGRFIYREAAVRFSRT